MPSALFPLDLTRHADMKAWCDQVGIPAVNIPAEEGALVVTPVSEGELEAVFVEYVIRADGVKILDYRPCTPGDHRCEGFLRREKPTRLIVTEAPPGFALPSWDAFAYVQHYADPIGA